MLIASRAPWAVRDSVEIEDNDGGRAVIGGCKATATILWVHDVHVGPFAQADERRIDRILCLSQWHADYFASSYAGLDRSKVHVTRNGIDLSRFEGTEQRQPHRAIYSSSPDRGLLAAVLAWPRIREQVPDAELHVFYGFLNWERGCGGDPAQLAAIARLKHLCATTPGVVMRDRVNQKELAREFMRAGVWAYPTWFSETSCITAMEAQAAGLYTVTSKLAALNETVADYGWRQDWLRETKEPTEEYVEQFIGHVVSAMTVPEPLGISRDGLRQEAGRFSLDTLADEWSAMLLELEAERKLEPVPKFQQGAAE